MRKFLAKAGEYLPGIPARDLTDDDYAELTPEQQQQVDDSPLYEAHKADPKAPKPAAEPAAADGARAASGSSAEKE